MSLQACVSAIRVPPGADDRRLERLQSELGLDTVVLSPDERIQLCSLVAEFSHLFALDSRELGRTSLVTHHINTGDSPPIKQPPQRLPFALRHRMCQWKCVRSSHYCLMMGFTGHMIVISQVLLVT